MQVKDIQDKLELKVYAGQRGLSREVKGAYVSDLLSDILGNASEGQVLITLQTHKNVLGVAVVKTLSAVILVHGFVPEIDMAQQADTAQIPILGTDLTTFEITGKLYNLLNNTN